MRNPFKTKPKKANPDVVKIKESFQIVDIIRYHNRGSWVMFGDANKFIDYAQSEGQERIFCCDEQKYVLFFFYVSKVCICIELPTLVDE